MARGLYLARHLFTLWDLIDVTLADADANSLKTEYWQYWWQFYKYNLAPAWELGVSLMSFNGCLETWNLPFTWFTISIFRKSWNELHLETQMTSRWHLNRPPKVSCQSCQQLVKVVKAAPPYGLASCHVCLSSSVTMPRCGIAVPFPVPCT